MIDQLITGYLKDNKRLVIPGFGAFIRKDGGETVFVEFLKKDDGVFSSLVRSQMGLTEPKATAYIETYVSELKRSVRENSSYVIAGLGRMYMTPNGLYELEHVPGISANAETEIEKPGIPAAQPTEKHEQKAVTPQVVKQVVSTEDAVAKETPQVMSARSADETARPATVSEPAKEQKAKPVYKPATSAASTTQAPSAANTKPAPSRSHRPAQRNAKKADMVIIIAIAAAILAIGVMVFGFIVQSPAKQLRSVGPAVEQPAEPTLPDSTANPQ